jgi:hypothetical protein
MELCNVFLIEALSAAKKNMKTHYKFEKLVKNQLEILKFEMILKTIQLIVSVKSGRWDYCNGTARFEKC